MVVANALRIATEGKEVNVVADDTDVLILLMYHWIDTIYGRCIFSDGLSSRNHRRNVCKCGEYVI